jgi:hypothetical protein
MPNLSIDGVANYPFPSNLGFRPDENAPCVGGGRGAVRACTRVRLRRTARLVVGASELSKPSQDARHLRRRPRRAAARGWNSSFVQR